MAGHFNTESTEYWNGDGGKQWVHFDARFDDQLESFGRAVLERASLQHDERVVDLGCGTAALTIDAARTVGFFGRVAGVDVSKRMLRGAQSKLDHIDAGSAASMAPIELLRADVQTEPLGVSEYDVALSRFGVMFFEDPEAAFANVRRSVRPGGRLVFACWQSPADNLWLSKPRAAVAHLLELPTVDPEVPGPFSLARIGRTLAMLGRAGWIGASARSVEVDLHIGGLGSVADAVEFVTHSGQIGVALQDRKKKRRKKVEAALTAALEPHYDGAGVSLPAAAWIIEARR